MTTAASPPEIARTVLDALDRGRQIPLLSETAAGFDLAAAYRATSQVRRLREARGEVVVGRKIGFTNTTIWAEYGVDAPIWGYVYDTTWSVLGADPVPIAGLVEPRLEPEIMLHLSRAPAPDMDDRALMECVGAVSHGYEIVQSLFPEWRFTPADTVAAFGLHGRLLTGTPHEIRPAEVDRWLQALGTFSITLSRDGKVVDRGVAANVLGEGPLAALRHVVASLATDTVNPPLAAGEIVSTGTLTRAFPIAAGETWSTTVEGLDLPGVAATFV